jgi:VWFA-related protein
MKRFFLTFCLLTLSLFSYAQSPNQKPVAKVSTRLVQVNAVVQDKKGGPVKDLTQDDFVLYDEGKIQKIVTFAKVTDETPQIVNASLPPDVVSNRLANSTKSGAARLAALPNSITVILIDYINTTWVDNYYARDALRKFLLQIQPGDRVAIYALADGLRVLHEFSSDTVSMLAALNRNRDQPSFMSDASNDKDSHVQIDTPFAGDLADSVPWDSLIKGLNKYVIAYYKERRIEATLEALTSLAGHLSGVSGRKNVVWLSSSFPLVVGQNPQETFSTPQGSYNSTGSMYKTPTGPDTNSIYSQLFRTFGEEMQRTLRILNDAGIAIYPVDVRGLIGFCRWNPSMCPESPSSNGLSAADASAHQDILDSWQTMNTLAKYTGGLAFRNSNDVSGAIRKAVADTSVTYMLGYIPSDENWDGKYHKIRLKTKRSGLEARYRQGYYAAPELASDNAVRGKILNAAANAPLLCTGLGILAKIAAMPTAARPQATIEVILDARELMLTSNDKGEHETNLDLVAIVFDAEHRSLNQSTRGLHFSIKPAQLNPSNNQELKVSIDVDTPAKSDHVRLVFRDIESGTIGSIDVPLKNEEAESGKGILGPSSLK